MLLATCLTHLAYLGCAFLLDGQKIGLSYTCSCQFLPYYNISLGAWWPNTWEMWPEANLILHFAILSIKKVVIWVKRFWQKSLANPIIFHLTPIWSLAEPSKLEAAKSSLSYKVFVIKKSLQICYSNIKSVTNKSTRIFLIRRTFI